MVTTHRLRPGCIFWTNHLKLMGYEIMCWTAATGLAVYLGWEDAIKQALGIPIAPAMEILTGYIVICGNAFVKSLTVRHPGLKLNISP